jgi:lipopolysaccharide transport system ATP-binding protein
MNDIAIHVDKVSKCFAIGSGTEYARLTESLATNVKTAARSIWNKTTKPLLQSDVSSDSRRDGNQFWALRDIDFKVHCGEAVAIVGGNGAGKSTLLKILSRIVSPTLGRVGVRGRVGCLLEVGTGFHPELTGRENVFLNGTILGMSRREIRRRFDEIVSFAEVETFIDTPVKRYSNGMIIRLGFSVAAHFEPEVFIIDEVLGVGDAAFQAKSLAKAKEFRDQGRTVLLVSHYMPSVIEFATRAILIREGHIVADGEPSQVVDMHLRGDSQK